MNDDSISTQNPRFAAPMPAPRALTAAPKKLRDPKLEFAQQIRN